MSKILFQSQRGSISRALAKPNSDYDRFVVHDYGDERDDKQTFSHDNKNLIDFVNVGRKNFAQTLLSYDTHTIECLYAPLITVDPEFDAIIYSRRDVLIDSQKMYQGLNTVQTSHLLRLPYYPKVAYQLIYWYNLVACLFIEGRIDIKVKANDPFINEIFEMRETYKTKTTEEATSFLASARQRLDEIVASSSVKIVCDAEAMSAAQTYLNR